ncbi:poly-gamma-glutamate biosynthesis protein [Candidatus Atribacteria bacterium HGW-Atribacteria-1]|nr:MAG: poly-gamma-glutamate biosynthesis protein [Candidatus Atribacteria bacterium HGW-Atribacteria-1]
MNTINLLAVGDISLKTRNNKLPFEKVKEIFKDKDILFGNLETVLSNQGRETEKAVSLYTSPDKVNYLKGVGFDILNIANNHIMDLGIEGFNETLKVLTKNNINFIGARNKFERNYLIVEKQGIKSSFLSYTEDGFSLPEKNVWINKLEPKDIIRDIFFVKQQCDLIIVSLHWGIENVFYPSPQQIDLAHKIIDSGATIILGHHPHVIQGIERYKNGLIAYSLGNFQFDPSISYSPNNYSFILLIELTKDGLQAYDINPVKIDDEFIPYVPTEEEQEEIRQFISEKSQHINNGSITRQWWFEQIAGEYLSGNMKSFIIRIKRFGFRHFLQCIRWLISPFVIRCYIGFLLKKLKGQQLKDETKLY